MEAYKEAAAAAGKEAANRVAGGAAAAGSASAVTRKLNMTLEEAENILNVRRDAPLEEVVKVGWFRAVGLEISKADQDISIEKQRYQTLFESNDPKSGGSFYLQSKVYRAKERLEAELKERAQEMADEERAR